MWCSNNVIFKVKCAITSNDRNDWVQWRKEKCRLTHDMNLVADYMPRDLTNSLVCYTAALNSIFPQWALFGQNIPSRSSNTHTLDAQSQHKLKCFSYIRLMRNEVALSHSMAIIMLRNYSADKREQDNWWSAILSLGCTHDSNRIMTGNRKISRSHYIITAISLIKFLSRE